MSDERTDRRGAPAGDHERLRRFLLGQASEDERAAVEEQLFLERDQLLALDLAEDELIDAYACDELSRDERRRFDERFLAVASDRARVRFAQGLAARTQRGQAASAPAPAQVVRPRRRRRWQPLVMVAAAAALALVIGSLRGGRGALELHLSLAPAVTRDGASVPVLRMARATERVRVRLLLEAPLPSGLPTVDVLVRRGDAQVGRWAATVADAGATLALVLPRASLAVGSYELTALVPRASGGYDELVFPFEVSSQ